MNPVVHFEMPFEDQKRMTKFYTQVFDWQMRTMGPEMGNYVLATTSEMDEKTKFPKKPGMINGGFFPKMKDAQHPLVVIGVDDIQASMKKIEAAGGKIIGGQKLGIPDDIPGVGLYIAFMDTEGNRACLLQPKGM